MSSVLRLYVLAKKNEGKRTDAHKEEKSEHEDQRACPAPE